MFIDTSKSPEEFLAYAKKKDYAMVVPFSQNEELNQDYKILVQYLKMANKLYFEFKNLIIVVRDGLKVN